MQRLFLGVRMAHDKGMGCMNLNGWMRRAQRHIVDADLAVIDLMKWRVKPKLNAARARNQSDAMLLQYWQLIGQTVAPSSSQAVDEDNRLAHSGFG